VASDKKGVEMNPVTYRAVLVANEYTSSSVNYSYGSHRAMNEFRSMLNNLTSTNYTVYAYTEQSANGILNCYSNIASYADSNDVTLFYYKGHGGTGSGALIGTDGYGVYPSTLRSRLDQYQGKKVLVISSCHSGYMIGKDGEERPVTKADLDGFTSRFISAFAGKGSNDLATSGYYVLTACHSTQSSYNVGYTGDLSSYWNLFTRSLTYGCGWNGENKQTIEYKLTLDSNPEFTASVLVAYARAAMKMHGRGITGCQTVFDAAPADLSPLTRDQLLAHTL
jgi:hypothetical protein